MCKSRTLKVRFSGRWKRRSYADLYRKSRGFGYGHDEANHYRLAGTCRKYVLFIYRGDELAFYQSPDGLVEGDVYLKRNISIRKENLNVLLIHM